MRTAKLNWLSLSAAVLIFAGGPAAAAPVTGPWTNATGQGDGPITQADTGSPIVGDGSANSADAEMLDSPFPAITLANTGDRIVFTGNVELVGTVGSAGGPRTQFRFGLFQDDGDGDDLEWIGYYMSNSSGTGTPAGTLARKPVGNTSVYLSVTGQNSLATTQGNGVNFTDDTYAMNLTIERSGADLMVSGTLAGMSNGFTQSLSAIDMTASTMGTYTFDHLGFLLGGNLDTDQAFFSNLDVTFTPASTGGLAGDYNDNDVVDAADYAVWRDNEGTTNTLANDPLGGTIDGRQYDQWQASFGDIPGSGVFLADSAIPEPASCSMLLVLSLAATASDLARRIPRRMRRV